MTDDAPITADLNAPPMAASETVGTHLACISCQYDLHNLPRSGKCPECGGEIAATLAASRLDPNWLKTIRLAMRWLVASMYVFAYLVASRYFRSMEFAVIAVMQLGATLNLMTRNPNRAHEPSGTRWPALLMTGAIATYLISAGDWIVDSDSGWLLLSLGAAMHSASLALAWFRIGAVAAQGIAPRSTNIARNIGVLTIVMGLLTILPAIVLQFGFGGQLMNQIAVAIRWLWLVALLVWFFTSLVTLHLMSVSLRRLIETPSRSGNPGERSRIITRPLASKAQAAGG